MLLTVTKLIFERTGNIGDKKYRCHKGDEDYTKFLHVIELPGFCMLDTEQLYVVCLHFQMAVYIIYICNKNKPKNIVHHKILE